MSQKAGGGVYCSLLITLRIMFFSRIELFSINAMSGRKGSYITAHTSGLQGLYKDAEQFISCFSAGKMIY